MITVAETVAPAASLPNWQVATLAEVVHEPAETTLRMLNPAGAGASSWVFWSDLGVPFVNVVWYATVPPAVTGLGVPVSVADAVPPPWADAEDAPTRATTTARRSGRRRTQGVWQKR